MDFDIFFSISQTPVGERLPSEREMFENFFAQVEAADELGFGTAWIAEAHLSSEIQKSNRKPVIPHWQGEVGLNTDFLQLSHHIFARTKRIETGSAVMNILCGGGPIAHAERVATFLALHGLDPTEARRIHVGFAAGRFDFNNSATGVRPRDAFEAHFWPAVKGKVFEEAALIFTRLLRGDVLKHEDIPQLYLRRENFRSEEDWQTALSLADATEAIPVRKFWAFEELKIVPQEFRRELLQLIIGSHDPELQECVNEIYPVQVFNLSITRPEIIEQTHERMRKAYHPDGGAWLRRYMPRTVFVFLNDELDSAGACRAAAQEEARAALSAYWTALEGTLDPAKVEKAADNALIGNVEDVTEQMRERFHPDDRVMLWFDFFNHDSERVIRNMEAFMTKVAPLLPS
jgi:alkanesulfonate monooxygenase SsuD/methylene tetrahydromethanopterin reductase-like flavin-dependent oxidoreductase (luciferase family)